MPRGPHAARKSVRTEEEIHHLHAPQRLHFSDVSLPPPSAQGVTEYSSKQRTGDELNVNKYPQGVESFVTKRHSWEGKGLGNQSSTKALQAGSKEQRERGGKPRADPRLGFAGAGPEVRLREPQRMASSRNRAGAL